MKGKKRLLATLTSVAMLIGCIAMPVSADSNNVITTWEELKDAIAAVPTNADSATRIDLGADIRTEGMIQIGKGQNVLLNMHGYTLEREIYNQDRDGHVIIVAPGAELQIYGSGSPDRGNGTIKGGFAYNGGGVNNKGTLGISYVNIIDNNAGDTADNDSTRGGGIWNSGTLFLGACVISGNKSDDGGGIYNDEEGSIILNDVSITGNTSLLHGGGGITNYGSLTFMSENTITGNTSKSNGGGVWNKGTFTIDDSDNKLIIKDNDSTDYLADNLFLFESAKIRLEEDAVLSSDTEIYVSSSARPSIITAGWTYGSNQTMIIPEAGMTFDYSGTELTAVETRTYIERSWDSVNKRVTETVKDIPQDAVSIGTVINSPQYQAGDVISLYDVCVYVDQTVTIDKRIQARRNVRIILKDGVTLTCNKSIETIGTDAYLSIYGQSANSGTLVANGDANMAGIGGHVGKENGEAGNITIHGGTIVATGGNEAAGIGTGKGNWMSTITIFGGNITANGGKDASGIGVGTNGYVSNITIYGGNIEATGNVTGDGFNNAGAGIGGADNLTSSITINGGTINAYGRGGGAGIGSSYYKTQSGSITINGGRVYAHGSSGGTNAGPYSNDDPIYYIGGAGIGAGACADSVGLIQINGGYVEAESVEIYKRTICGGCGIGAGHHEEENYGTTRVEINGGEVITRINNPSSASIGASDGTWHVNVSFEEMCGELVLYSGAEVLLNDVLQPKDDRISACRTRGHDSPTTVHIKPCSHPSVTYTKDVEGHTAACGYCATAFAKEPHHYDSHNKCTVCGYERSAPVCKGHSVLLKEGKIGLKFFMDLSGLTDEEKAGSYMKFDIAGKGEVTEQDNYDANSFVTLEGKTCNGFTAEINAIQMADKITATFYYYQDGEWKTVVNTYSVKQYCDDFTDKWNKQESHSEADAKAKPLIEALADYGHYLQIYLKGIRGWNFDPENGYTEMSTVYKTYTDDALASEVTRVRTSGKGHPIRINNSQNSDIKKITYSLTFDSDTCINVYFEMNDGAAYDGHFSIVGLDNNQYWLADTSTPHEYSTGETLTMEKMYDGRYRVKISGINAQHLDNEYAFNVVTEVSRGTDSDTASVNVTGLSYVYSLTADGKDADTKKAAVAIFRYYEEASKYAGNS